MDKATKYVLVATFISFLYSVYLFFFMDSPDSKLYGIFVGIWVPSILSAFTVLKSSIKKENLKWVIILMIQTQLLFFSWEFLYLPFSWLEFGSLPGKALQVKKELYLQNLKRKIPYRMIWSEFKYSILSILKIYLLKQNSKN